MMNKYNQDLDAENRVDMEENPDPNQPEVEDHATTGGAATAGSLRRTAGSGTSSRRRWDAMHRLVICRAFSIRFTCQSIKACLFMTCWGGRLAGRDFTKYYGSS